MISRGDPRVFAPDLYNKMTRFERWQVVNAYESRLLHQGEGNSHYPDNEAPWSVAKRSFMSGLATTSLVLAAPFIMVCAGAISFLNAGDRTAMAIGIAAGSGCVSAVVLGAWFARVQQIQRYFGALPRDGGSAAGRGVSGDEVVGSDEDDPNGHVAGRSPVSNLRRGQIMGLWLSVFLTWIAWSVTNFSALIPIAMTLLATGVTTGIVLMRRGNTST